MNCRAFRHEGSQNGARCGVTGGLDIPEIRDFTSGLLRYLVGM
jgi:hypothetical protein